LAIWDTPGSREARLPAGSFPARSGAIPDLGRSTCPPTRTGFAKAQGLLRWWHIPWRVGCVPDSGGTRLGRCGYGF
jgi:hypothetical protein